MSSRAPARGFTQTDEYSNCPSKRSRAWRADVVYGRWVSPLCRRLSIKRFPSTWASRVKSGSLPCCDRLRGTRFRSGHVPRREQSLHYALTRTIGQILLRRRYVCEQGRGRSRRSCWICPTTGQRWLALCDLFPIDRFAVAQVGRRSGLVARKVGVDVARCRKANSSGATPPS